MPTLEHELPLRFLDDRPDLAVDLALAGGLRLPPHARLAVTSGDMSRTGSVIERRVDRMVLMHDAEGSTVGVLLVEVQRSADAEARERWPGKLVEAWERHRCDAYLLVVCPDSEVAEWASKPLRIGAPNICGLSLKVLAVPPRLIPRIDNADQVPENPELSVLSALAHGGDGTDDKVLPTLLSALAGLIRNPRPDTKLNYSPERYLDYLYDAGSDVIRKRMEALMTTTDEYFRYSIPFLREAQEKAFTEGYAKARVELTEQARREADEKARHEISVRVLLKTIEVRGIEIDEDQRRLINECSDVEQVDSWLCRAAIARNAGEIFD